MFAQFVTMTRFPGTVDFDRWEKSMGDNVDRINGVPITRYWLIPGHLRPKLYTPHLSMSAEEIRRHTQWVLDSFYSLSAIRKRTDFVKSIRARLALLFISKLYRQMYASTGIATDTARRDYADRWAGSPAKPCRQLFRSKPMPNLATPSRRGLAFVTIRN